MCYCHVRTLCSWIPGRWARAGVQTFVKLRDNVYHNHKHQGLDPLIRSISRVTAARANASSVFQLFSFLVVCSVIISKGFGFVAFFASEETGSFCIHPKTDLVVTIQSTTLSWMEAKNPPQNKYCHKSQSAVIRCMSALVKVTLSSLHHDGSPWQVCLGTCHRSCWEGRIACQHCRRNLWSSHVYCNGMATEILEGWASLKA